MKHGKHAEVRQRLSSSTLADLTAVPERIWSAFWDKTDRGTEPSLSEEDLKVFESLLQVHRMQALDYNCWKQDFKRGILFLSDFDDAPYLRRSALRAYRESMGDTTYCQEWGRKWAR